MSRVSSLPISSLAGCNASAIRSGTIARQGIPELSGATTGGSHVRADAGMIAMSAAHSAPAGIATGSPCPRHAPALLAQYNAAARAFRSRSSGLVAGTVSFAPERGTDRQPIDLGGRARRQGPRRGRLGNLQAELGLSLTRSGLASYRSSSVT